MDAFFLNKGSYKHYNTVINIRSLCKIQYCKEVGKNIVYLIKNDHSSLQKTDDTNHDWLNSDIKIRRCVIFFLYCYCHYFMIVMSSTQMLSPVKTKPNKDFYTTEKQGNIPSK